MVELRIRNILLVDFHGYCKRLMYSVCPLTCMQLSLRMRARSIYRREFIFIYLRNLETHIFLRHIRLVHRSLSFKKVQR